MEYCGVVVTSACISNHGNSCITRPAAACAEHLLYRIVLFEASQTLRRLGQQKTAEHLRCTGRTGMHHKVWLQWCTGTMYIAV